MLLITSFMLSAPESSSSSVSLAGRGAPLLTWVSAHGEVLTGVIWGGALLHRAQRVIAGCSQLSTGSFTAQFTDHSQLLHSAGKVPRRLCNAENSGPSCA